MAFDVAEIEVSFEHWTSSVMLILYSFIRGGIGGGIVYKLHFLHLLHTRRKSME